MTALDAGRRAHYAGFYSDDVGHPLVVVGNCQAESLRLLLDPTDERSVRVPPVFELDAAEAARLHELVRHARALVVQPVRDGYRGLPLGTEQLRASLPAGARCVVVPIVRFTGLHPTQLVHHPAEGAEPMPLVPYHDLRVVRAALTGRDDVPALERGHVLAVAAASVAELRRRERHTDVAVSDLLAEPRPDDFRTVNHPGNRVLVGLASRVAAALDRPRATDPGVGLLTSVRAPVEPVVARTWGFGWRPEHADWWVEGERLPASDVAAAHRAHYAAHPPLATEVWQAHLATARDLGLAPWGPPR
ncbi:hypothetical protein GCM10023340_37310 [Nocardioides marinquilinus]|uniref:Polysaccharide biosynthesis enzyme WcbI domain-containing protein n=1 Tax=Nocardioides marinquilinus TaxID=1210400 RepID=A0ABP9Q3J8_9ACTN